MKKIIWLLSLVAFMCTSCGHKTTSVAIDDNMSEDSLYTMEGELIIGHEVRAFTPSGSDREFWIVDKTGQLLEKYDKITKGQKNGKPVKATLRLEYNGKWDDGFAAEYDGTFLVREVVELKAE